MNCKDILLEGNQFYCVHGNISISHWELLKQVLKLIDNNEVIFISVIYRKTFTYRVGNLYT